MPEAEQILARFKRAADWAARLAACLFDRAELYDDALQEARMLILSYAGLMPGWGYGTLPDIERDAEGDEHRVQAIVVSRLRLHLNQVLGRQLDKGPATVPVDLLPPALEPSCQFEDDAIDRADRERELRRRYPYLMMRFTDGASEREIAASAGVPLRTVQYRIAAEKRSVQADAEMAASAGLAA